MPLSNLLVKVALNPYVRGTTKTQTSVTQSVTTLYTLGPRTTLLLGHQKCSVVQKSAIQGYCYVVIVLYKKNQRYARTILYSKCPKN